MIIALTYISLICGGLLVLILLLGIFSGLDLDLDLDFDGADQSDVGMGFGVVKGGLTFLSVGAWVVKLVLLASVNPVVAVVAGAAAGAVAVYLLSKLVTYLLRYEENVNWSIEDAVLKPGKVYLRIPAGGEGIVQVQLKGGVREFKARSTDGADIPTGAAVFVDDLGTDGLVLVSREAG